MYGGGISMSNYTLIYSENSSFKDNSASQYGGGFEAHNGILNFTGNNIFKNNTAKYGCRTALLSTLGRTVFGQLSYAVWWGNYSSCKHSDLF